MPDPTTASPLLHVCVTCRAGQTLADGESPPGQTMYDALESLLLAQPVARLREVRCLSNCDHGCAASISAPGKWSYLLGRLTTALAPDLLAYAAAYAQSPTGTVLPSKRPASLARMVLGRVPDLSSPELAA